MTCIDDQTNNKKDERPKTEDSRKKPEAGLRNIIHFKILLSQKLLSMANFQSFFNKLSNDIKLLIKRYKLDALTDVALFVLITIVIHFLWRFWANQLHYMPLTEFMLQSQNWLAKVVFDQSIWFSQHILGIQMTIVEETKTMYFANKGFMAINQSCSGLKQIMQFVLLLMLIRGPWKRKVWFIPLGVSFVHLTNLVRIIGLSVVLTINSEYWKFSHDYIFRPLFYVVIFSLWVWWVERISVKKKLVASEPE
jgi:exosortase/archaeosortase family protein